MHFSPWAVAGLAKIEGEVIDGGDDLEDEVEKKYSLRGMVVHSGQASGGHYYSYIRSGSPDTTTPQHSVRNDMWSLPLKLHLSIRSL